LMIFMDVLLMDIVPTKGEKAQTNITPSGY
jgi:hypothetical protein